MTFAFLLLFSVAFATFISAALQDCSPGDKDCKTKEAYSCLEGKISDKTCSNLSPEEKVFSFLATGKCKSETLNSEGYKEDITFTAKTLLALKESGSNTDDAKDWLFDFNRSSIGLEWFLEIESPESTICTVDYSNSNTIKINKDKTIASVTGGSCLKKSSNGYWVEISSGCYDEEFKISCDKQFLTTLIYKAKDGETIYVSEKTSSASASGETKEKVKSMCFSTSSNSCDYEGTLWAAFSLSVLGGDVTSYLPYLITFSSENEKLLPEAFLYSMTGNNEFKNLILSKQINNKWWVSKEDTYYGTAVALLPFQFEEPIQKKDSLTWLFNEAQGSDGCWDSGNIKSNAFLLYSISPRSVPSSESACELSGFFCTSQIRCKGNVLPGYACSGAFVCCSTEPEVLTCAQQEGEICNSGQTCKGTGSLTVDASNLNSGEICCLEGTCSESTSQGSALSECEISGGECRINSCLSGEEKSFKQCSFSSDICCVQKTSSGTNYFWIWFLVILIVLVAVGIFFHDKLRHYWVIAKSRFGNFKGFGGKSSSGSPPPGPSGAPPSGFTPLRRIPPQRRILPGSGGNHERRVPKSRSQSEIDEVLKKLKEIGK